ncbi:CyP450 monooxygenase [Trametes meyenii]|nr:CyP450 monooxygenase [Trametes meyenii]
MLFTEPALSYTLLVAVIAVGTACYFTWRRPMGGPSLPPGPSPLPLIGNVFSIPKTRPWLGFQEMCKTYGDLVYLRTFRQPLLVVGSAEAAIELLEKRSANTSDRLPSPVFELAGHSFNMAFMPYGQRWRNHRRLVWQHFHPAVLSRYYPIQQAKTHIFLLKVLESPARLQTHLANLFTATSLKVIYDIDVASEDDERVQLVEDAVQAVKLLTPGSLMIEFFPFLRHAPGWVPGAGFWALFARCRETTERLRNTLFLGAKESLEKGELRPCMAGCILESAAKSGRPEPYFVSGEEEEMFKNVCAASFVGGVDTVLVAFQAALVALAIHPHVQKKAQAELDAVVGYSRLPDFNDRDSFVYINALVKEVLRWHTIGPFAIPHRIVNDEEFRGYLIPAGTLVISNVWLVSEMLHDPEAYDCPEEFRPERFIRDGKLDPTVRDPMSYAFGFAKYDGFRICPGRHHALASLFLAIASILHVFDIGLPLDEDGQPIQIKYEPSDELLSSPVDIRCRVTLRSAGRAELVTQACANSTDGENVYS